MQDDPQHATQREDEMDMISPAGSSKQVFNGTIQPYTSEMLMHNFQDKERILYEEIRK
jgi:hypothetical protein